MPQVNIGGVVNSQIVDMTQAEASDYWFKGKLPARLGLSQLADGRRVTAAGFTRLADGRPVTNEAEAYWASQPPEVQQLMHATNESQRLQLAHDLADRGFLIDVPIMVWGWDPLSTMVVRRNQGYAWVPSAKMDPVAVAPGVNFPGLPTYDPKNPPTGAIPVTTQWAKGFETTSPWPIEDDGNGIIF